MDVAINGTEEVEIGHFYQKKLLMKHKITL